MATKSNFATLVLVVATAVALLDGTAATVYFVGDNLGWTLPASGAGVYANWSSQHNFTTGDILVTKDALDACNSTSPISLLTLSPANFTFSSDGDHHFICTFGQHCIRGQKLSISVSSSSPSSPPASPPTITPSPSPSSSMTPSPTPSATTSPPQSPATSPSPLPSATPPASTTSPPPPPATTSSPSPPSETTLTPPPPPPSSAPLKAVATTLTIMSIALGVIF